VVRLHAGGLLVGLAGTVAVLTAIARLADPSLMPSLAVAMVLGAAFVWLDYGFTAGFRAYLADGDGRALGAAFLVPAVAALAVVPVGSLGGDYIRFVAPIGPPLIFGAAMFGVGMQIANGCGSGSLVAAWQGSRRMWVVLPFFCVGGVLGSLVLPAALRLPGFGAVDLPTLLGPWTGLLATEALLAAGALFVLRGAWPQRGRAGAAALIGALAALLFLVSGEPWGITMGLTVAGAQALLAVGLDVSGHEFWADAWTRQLLHGPLLAMHGALSDVGLLLGALLSAAILGRLRPGTPLGWRGAAGAAVGGVLMGVGARLSFGCNVGAFVGGVSSGSLHGFVWLIAVLPGCWLGIRLRPWCGLIDR
jgi:uncharacterized protein